MNQKKIGEFIALCRKKKQLTQTQLGNRLGVSAKSVSKWENGVCLPDPSLYQSLCELLDMTMNELFSGKRIEKNNQMKINEHLLTLLEKRIYDSGNISISFDEFDTSLKRFSEAMMLLKKFESKEEAVAYLVKGSGLSENECEKAYEFYKRLW